MTTIPMVYDQKVSGASAVCSKQDCKAVRWTNFEVATVIETTPIPMVYNQEAYASSADSSASGQFPVFNRVRTSMYRNQAERYIRF
ncbi:hypothetical protein T10_1470 [Trichinella papuae]|uniref:Uncharacterized protein n=1 Tax=Trichinella papuae TaxID=268474 RepID=A0A0V1ML78_9BILA|nr:hypothetical protein T10_1470 [Trichinella papuae]